MLCSVLAAVAAVQGVGVGGRARVGEDKGAVENGVWVA